MTTTKAALRIEVWRDSSDPDSPAWRVLLSRDGGAEEVLDTLADEDSEYALRAAREEAYERMLPLYRREGDGPASLVEEAREKVPDGEYYIASEGSCWRYQQWVGGRRVGSTDEANMGSHRAARDQYAHCDPDLATEEVPVPVQRSIVGPDADLSRVCVMRVPDEE